MLLLTFVVVTSEVACVVVADVGILVVIKGCQVECSACEVLVFIEVQVVALVGHAIVTLKERNREKERETTQ